jgi:hypothetical protein
MALTRRFALIKDAKPNHFSPFFHFLQNALITGNSFIPRKVSYPTRGHTPSPALYKTRLSFTASPAPFIPHKVLYSTRGHTPRLLPLTPRNPQNSSLFFAKYVRLSVMPKNKT